MALALALSSCSAKVYRPAEWVSSERDHYWNVRDVKQVSRSGSDKIVVLNLGDTLQTVEGFGACFNELGWTSLSHLSERGREEIMKELFSTEGMNLTVNRLPIGANDFARDYYSYCDVDGDFEMTNFSVANDEETLIPFAQAALRVNPRMKIWASPWCPPSWMKTNKHYACSVSREWVKNSTTNDNRDEDFCNAPWAPNDRSPLRFRMVPVNNGLSEEQAVTKEGTDNFIQEPRYLQAYALYFGKYIDAYKDKGINISMVMPQNEPNSAQPYPACLWSSKGLINFISYLGPEMEKRGVDIFCGTMERANPELTDSIIVDALSGKYIKGAGFQWAGKDALPEIHRRHPDMTMYQTEQECGNGLNNWEGALHSWNLMRHYFGNGVNAYCYWNISLLRNGVSRWGWCQNSLVTVDKDKATYRFTPEAYLLKHVSHYVKPGAKLLKPSGNHNDILAFLNPDNSIAVVIGNQTEKEMPVSIVVDGDAITIPTAKSSVNTILLSKK